MKLFLVVLLAIVVVQSASARGMGQRDYGSFGECQLQCTIWCEQVDGWPSAAAHTCNDFNRFGQGNRCYCAPPGWGGV